MSYSASKTCPNCGTSMTMDIPKGMMVRDFIQAGKVMCPNCNVNYLDSISSGGT